MSHPPSRLSSPRRRGAALALGVALVTGLAGCGSSSSSSGPSSSASSSASSSGSSSSGAQTLAITVTGNTVEPENERIQVALKKPLTLRITSDRAGELHVHSSPEQHVEFTKGTTTKTITFTVPGVIELEEHKSDSLIAQLEVR